MRTKKNHQHLLSASTSVTIPFHDVDMLEVAWHGHYIKYFELARCVLLNKINYNYDAMRRSGYAWPVVDLHVKYINPARFGQTVDVACHLIEYENRLILGYTVSDPETKTVLTRGKTTQVAVDIDRRELQLESPAALTEKVEALL